MILQNNGIKTDKFFVPPFELNEGDFLVLCLFGGSHFYESSMLLKDIFTGKSKNDNVIRNKPLTFVPHFIEPTLRRLFHPITIGEYLKKSTNQESHFAEKIYDGTYHYITPKTKIQTIPWNPRKLLSLYSTLSHTKDVIFDLAGVDPLGAAQVCEIVKQNVKAGGSAILLDNFNDMKEDCTKYIEVEWTK